MFYKWESEAREAMLAGLRPKKRGKDNSQAEIERLKEELNRKNTVIAELTEALVQEKKGLSDYLRKRD